MAPRGSSEVGAAKAATIRRMQPREENPEADLISGGVRSASFGIPGVVLITLGAVLAGFLLGRTVGEGNSSSPIEDSSSAASAQAPSVELSADRPWVVPGALSREPTRIDVLPREQVSPDEPSLVEAKLELKALVTRGLEPDLEAFVNRASGETWITATIRQGACAVKVSSSRWVIARSLGSLAEGSVSFEQVPLGGVILTYWPIRERDGELYGELSSNEAHTYVLVRQDGTAVDIHVGACSEREITALLNDRTPQSALRDLEASSRTGHALWRSPLEGIFRAG